MVLGRASSGARPRAGAARSRPGQSGARRATRRRHGGSGGRSAPPGRHRTARGHRAAPSPRALRARRRRAGQCPPSPAKTRSHPYSYGQHSEGSLGATWPRLGRGSLNEFPLDSPWLGTPLGCPFRPSPTSPLCLRPWLAQQSARVLHVVRQLGEEEALIRDNRRERSVHQQELSRPVGDEQVQPRP